MALVLLLVLAALAAGPQELDAQGQGSGGQGAVHAVVSVAQIGSGGQYGYRAANSDLGYSASGSIVPTNWQLTASTGTVATTVTQLSWDANRVYFKVDECVFEDGRDLLGLVIAGFVIKVTPEDRTDCRNYTIPYSLPHTDLYAVRNYTQNVIIYWPPTLYDESLTASILLPRPTGFMVSPPVPIQGGSYSYRVEAQWDYVDPAPGNGWFSVEWNGAEAPVGRHLATARVLTTPGPVTVRVRLNIVCKNGSTTAGCTNEIGGTDYSSLHKGVTVSRWSEPQTVHLPSVDEQFPTGTTTAAPPPAIVDALTGVFGAFGVQDPAPTAHLWSIMLCLLLAVGLAAFCIASTGGGPGSIFLGGLAFLLMFSLAGPTAFGVPSVFAGMALLVPGLGMVLFLKTKVR